MAAVQDHVAESVACMRAEKRITYEKRLSRGRGCRWRSGCPSWKMGVSNCLENQAGCLAATRHGIPLFSIALRIVSSFRMQTVNANFFAFPA